MRFAGRSLSLGLLLLGLLAGCGGGSTPPVPLVVTTTSLPQGQTSSVYNSSLSATGGTSPYTWTLKSGKLPAGLSLSSSGTISGTPTAPGSFSFAVQVSDSAKMPQSTSANLSIAISGGTLQITTTTAPTGTVGTAYNFQLAATGGVPPYTWALATGASLPAGLSLSSAGVVSGTPTAAGAFSPSITVTDSATNSTTQQVNFTINPSGKPLPDGSYAFQFNGVAPDGNPVAINGAFQIANGALPIGFYNENELNQAPQPNQDITGGSASIAANGLGQLVLKLQSGNITFALAVPASALTAGTDADIRLIEFDDTTGTGMQGSGVLKATTINPVLSSMKGGYAFALRGYDTHSQPAAVAGSFQADGLGNITSGSVDMNDNGTLSNYPTVTGSYTIDSIGGGVITLKLGATTFTYNYFQVTPTELLATSGDISSPTIPLVSGTALQQSGTPFSNATFTAVNVLETTGSALQGPAALIPDVSLGLLLSDGNGNVAALYDEFKSSLLAQTYVATYAVDPTTGRTPITSGSSLKTILYLVSNTRAFVLGADTSTSSGITEAQTGLPFTNTSLKGSYLGGTLPWPELNVVSLAAPDGAGNIKFTSNTSGSKGLKTNVTTSGTYSVDISGRAPVTVSGDATPRILYVVSPTKAVLLSGEAGGYLASFEQ
ncbi:MAG TPA: Ig domain-containing protein [Acidobacteriaceae bacterium]